MGKVLYRLISNKNFINNSNMESAVNANEVCRIAVGASIKGDLSSRTDIRVDGNVDGILHSEGRIVVGESAVLSGKILCRNLDFWGKIDGDLYVQDTLSLKSSAAVNGNIYVSKIQMELGVKLNGCCKMISSDEYDGLVEANVKNRVPASASAGKGRRD